MSVFKSLLNEEAIYKLSNIVEMENKFDRNYLLYKTGNRKKGKTYYFKKFEAIRSFGI